jgi:hypothetical protein
VEVVANDEHRRLSSSRDGVCRHAGARLLPGLI